MLFAYSTFNHQLKFWFGLALGLDYDLFKWVKCSQSLVNQVLIRVLNLLSLISDGVFAHQDKVIQIDLIEVMISYSPSAALRQ